MQHSSKTGVVASQRVHLATGRHNRIIGRFGQEGGGCGSYKQRDDAKCILFLGQFQVGGAGSIDQLASVTEREKQQGHPEDRSRWCTGHSLSPGWEGGEIYGLPQGGHGLRGEGGGSATGR